MLPPDNSMGAHIAAMVDAPPAPQPIIVEKKLPKFAFILNAQEAKTQNAEVQEKLRNADTTIGQNNMRKNVSMLKAAGLLPMALYRLERKWENIRGHSDEDTAKEAVKALTEMIQNMHEIIVEEDQVKWADDYNKV